MAVPTTVRLVFLDVLQNIGILHCIKIRKNAKVRWKKGKILSKNLSVLAQRNDLQKWKDIVLTMEKDGLQKPHFLV
jgi:hypothetical protein